MRRIQGNRGTSPLFLSEESPIQIIAPGREGFLSHLDPSRLNGDPMHIAEQVYETVKNLPERQAAEVLDFAEYLKAKLPASPTSSMSTEEAQELRAELRAWVTSQPEQPENASDFIRRLRDEARY